MAGDLARACLEGAQVDPAPFLGDVEGEGVDQRTPHSPARGGSRTPQAGAGDAYLRRIDLPGEKPRGVEGDLDAHRGEHIAGQAVDAEREVIGREREVREHPEPAGLEAHALLGELRGDPLRQEIGHPCRLVEVGDPG